MLSTNFHTNLTGKNLKVVNITIFQLSNTAIYSIFTNYETDNIKERKINNNNNNNNIFFFI